MSMLRHAVVAATLLLGGLSAQTLTLDARGGSLGGTLDLDLYPGAFAFDYCMVVPSFNSGPTPLSLIDPADPRSLGVGTELASASFFGLFGFDLHCRFGPLAVPASPALVNLTLHFQGLTLPGQTTIFDRLSNARAVHFSTANGFRDRNVITQDERAFATALPRTDGTWMAVGGGRGGLLALTAHRSTDVYDPRTDLCTHGPQMTTERAMHAQTLLPNGRWLLTGGVDRLNDPQASCELYDPATDTFTAVAPMGSPRTGHTATLLADGRVFVTGGLVAMTVTPTPVNAIYDTTNTTEIYNPATDTWTPGPNLRTPRAAHVAIRRPDNKVILCGGISWDNIIIVRLPAVRATTDIYDPVANTISAGPTMASARSLIEPVDLGNNRWLFAGGVSALSLTNLGTPTASAEIYNATSNTWTTTGSMATARGMHKAWQLDGHRWLLAGGANGDIFTPLPVATTEVFDSTANTWSPGPTMNQARAAATMIVTPYGQVQLFGGGTTGGGITLLTEWYYF